MERTNLLLHPGERIRSPRILLMTWQGNRTMGIDGTITVQSNSQLNSTGADRTMVLMGILQGSGNLTTNGSAGTIRFLTDPRRRRSAEAAIWEEILDAFSAIDDIDFAYPTQRFYDNVTEGKPGARAEPEPGRG